MGGEDTAHFAVQAFDLVQVSVQGDTERHFTIGDPVGFELHQRFPEPLGFDVGGRVHHCRIRSLLLLHVSRQGVALGEIVPAGRSNSLPSLVRFERPPFQGGRQSGVQAVEIVEQIGRGFAGRGQQGVENDRLAIQAQVAAFRLQLGKGQTPIQPASGGPVPGDAGTVDQLAQQARSGLGRQQLDGSEILHQRPMGLNELTKMAGGRLNGRIEVGRFRGSPPASHPSAGVGNPAGIPVDGRPQLRVMAPNQEGLHLPDSTGQEAASLVLGKLADVAAELPDLVQPTGPAKEIEVEPGTRTHVGEQALPAVQYPIQLLGSPPVDFHGRQPADGHKLTGASEAGVRIRQPPPIGDLFSERSRSVVVPGFGIHVHRGHLLSNAG